MSTFELLKRTYPISQFERPCDGYNYIINNSTEEDRILWGVNDNLPKIININEKYIYQVAKEDGKFKIMSISFKNFAVIREKMFKFGAK